MPEFRRKRTRLPRASYQGRRWYFVTVCTTDRRPLFRDPRLVSLLLEVLREECSRHSFDVYAYCFMPDHVHLELVGLTAQANLIQLLRAFKGVSRTRAREFGLKNLWQKGFYDHVLREAERVNAVAWYIFNNPVRKAVVADMRQWPHSGSWMFDWRKALAPPEEFVPPWKM